MPKKYKTVSEKITDILLHSTPDEISEDSATEAIPSVVDFEDSYDLPGEGSTEFRKKNVKLLSEKSERYRGKIASRNDSESDSVNSNECHQEDSLEAENCTEMSDSCESSDEVLGLPTRKCNAIDIISPTNMQNEVKKGICVQNQLRIWENLLEVRISMQKVLGKANQLLPPTELYQKQTHSPALKEVMEECEAKSYVLLKLLLSLQNKLHEQFSEIKTSLKRTYADLNEICDVERKKYITQHLQCDFKEFRSYSNNVLLKWEDRTKLLTPGKGSKSKTLRTDFTVIQKVDNALLNLDSLIQKSQTPKSGASSQEKDEPNANVYDDTDFYHQQLRELIEYKADSSTNINHLTKQYIELQKLRQKMKKTTDTRASKGRKLRYTVHNKLINFMASDDTSVWTEESKNELCKSLFAI